MVFTYNNMVESKTSWLNHTADWYTTSESVAYTPDERVIRKVRARIDQDIINSFKHAYNDWEKLAYCQNAVKFTNSTHCDDPWVTATIERDPETKLREMIRARQAPILLGTRKPAPQRIDERERRARDTLRRLIGEAQYRRFLSHGFITARGKSGNVYQIFPGPGMTRVYAPDGRPIEKLCVILRGNFPPTDELITRFLLILNDEEHFRSLANVSSHHPAKPAIKRPDLRSLPDIFASYKRQAA